MRRTVALIEQQFGGYSLPLQQLRLVELGRDVLVVPPGAERPFNPFLQQWAFPFDIPARPAKLHSMAGPTPEEFFETALSCETKQDLLPQAIENYLRVVELAPDWIEAHINLGVAYYQMGQLSDARAAFAAAVALDPLNGISRYNLGCTLEEMGEYDAAIEHLLRAARAMPAHADVHFNLALDAVSSSRAKRHLGGTGPLASKTIFSAPKRRHAHTLPPSQLVSCRSLP